MICLVCSSLILGGCICTSDCIMYGYGLISFMLAAVAILMINSLVASENRRLDALQVPCLLKQKIRVNR